MLLNFLRALMGCCPICGGELKLIDHDCIEGDLYECRCCGHKWRTT